MAGREDLLEKKLDNLTKYYLCSDHFKDEDFLNPETDDKQLLILKRNNQCIPIPSKFEDNLMQNINLAMENQENFKSYKRPTITKHESLINVVYYEPPTKKNDEETYEEVEINPENIMGQEEHLIEFIEETDFQICRLCAKSASDMLMIFNNDAGTFTPETECVRLMPSGIISKDDGLPQTICYECRDKLQKCADLINGFVDNQSLF